MQNDCFNLTLLTQISRNMCYTNEISLLRHVLSGLLSDPSCLVSPVLGKATRKTTVFVVCLTPVIHILCVENTKTDKMSKSW